MTHIAVEKWCAKLQVGVPAAPEIEIHLAQSEQVKMIDQERAQKNDEQTCRIKRENDWRGDWVAYFPDHTTDRAPLPKHQQESKAGEQNVRTPLDRLRHDLGPGAFEPRSCHNAVL